MPLSFLRLAASVTTMAAILGAWVPDTQAQATGGTLQRVKERGFVTCGTSQGIAGFSRPDAQGRWSGFDTDYCRAIAAAIFGDPEKARYVALSSKDRLTALQSGEIDVLARTTTWTLSRDAGQGLNFAAVNFYDGQGFLIRKALNVSRLKDLGGASICVAQGTTTELTLADYFRANNLKYEVVAFGTVEEVTKAYEAGRCDAYTADLSQLASIRLTLAKADEHVLLADVISKEPIGSWVRQGDDQWFDVVRWTLFAMLNAEELGVTQANLAEMQKSQNPEVRRLLGQEGKFGESLGLSNDWVVQIVRAVGNYGESFDRHLGANSAIRLPRGVNNLWSKGGIHYAPPIR